MSRRIWPIFLAILTLAGSLEADAASRRKAPALTPEAVDEARIEAGRKTSAKRVDPAVVRAQVMLDRIRFSPGSIGGKAGPAFTLALAAFERENGLESDGKLDEASFARLAERSPDPAIVPYTLTEDDVKGPFTEQIPSRMEQQGELDRLGYRNALEGLAEKFHMEPALLRALNPGQRFREAGKTIFVANVRSDGPAEAEGRRDRKREGAGKGTAPELPKVSRVEVDKSKKEVRAFGEDGALVALYPASIGSEEKPAPSGTATVKGIARNPTYTYNPEYGFRGVKAKEKFDIKPGPNNPVGTVWIDLSVESYGIHGTPDPEKIGKSESHGCIRLTNWDAEELASMVRKGTEVVFVD